MPPGEDMGTLLLFLWIAPIAVAIIIARQKGYRLLLWVPLALIFSVLALCLIALLPTKGELTRRTRWAVRAWQEEKAEGSRNTIRLPAA
jgi:uncharacterized protein (DUF983 family)